MFTVSIRFLSLILLLSLLMAAGVRAQPGGFSLPSLDDLQQQLSGSGAEADSQQGGAKTGAAQDDTAERENLQATLTLRQEIDANQAQMEKLAQRKAEAPSEYERLRERLRQARRDQDRDWQGRYQALSLAALGDELSRQLQALEQNQQTLAEVSGELTRAQTLPERTQSTISDSLARSDDIRRRLNQQDAALFDAEKTRLRTELVPNARWQSAVVANFV